MADHRPKTGVLLVLAALALAWAPPAGAEARAPAVGNVAEAVARAARAEGARAGVPGSWPDLVKVSRVAGGRWAFGTVVLVPPAEEGLHPRDWLFLAERGDSGWRVALDGQAGFAELSAASPVVTDAERPLFAAAPHPRVDGDHRTGMQLPWAVGQTWTLHGGPHAHDAGAGPWSSVDLTGGDNRVLAARDGLAYNPCVGLIRVVHPDGYASRYYHLWNHIQPDGQGVATGAYLGDTGTEAGCGGSARSRHVHFSLMRDDAFVAIAGHIIGKWVFRDGPAQYGGSALHGSRVANVGGAMVNHGVLGRTQGIADADGGATVNRRSGPGTGHAIVGSVADGDTVTVQCSADGTTHSGRWGTTSLWNKLSDGTWVSGAYVYTGVPGPVNGFC